MHPRVLIVGTIPYNPKESSRAFDAYFHYWEPENLAQVFSNTQMPIKGHCGTLYQITDYRLLQRWKGRKIKTGRIFNYEDLNNRSEKNDDNEEFSRSRGAYKFGANHTPLSHLLRRMLWRKKLWCTEEFDKWLDNFKPECVFLSFSYDFFIPQIADYISKKFNIPIVSSIADDYYFNTYLSFNPLYYIYKYSYRSLIRSLLCKNQYAIYISDKIKEKYNSHFHLIGETVYLTSVVKRKQFVPVDKKQPKITYFGNIRMGRNHSLNDIGKALQQINPDLKLEVYTAEKDLRIYKELLDNPNIVFGGMIPYSEVQDRLEASDVTVIVEGFKKSEIRYSRYSLSTKAADALASGAAILTYGSADCGIVEYMLSTEASFVCTDHSQLVSIIEEILTNVDLQRKYYDSQIRMIEQHHNLSSSCSTFETIVLEAIQNHRKNVKRQNSPFNSVL